MRLFLRHVCKAKVQSLGLGVDTSYRVDSHFTPTLLKKSSHYKAIRDSFNNYCNNVRRYKAMAKQSEVFGVIF